MFLKFDEFESIWSRFGGFYFFNVWYLYCDKVSCVIYLGYLFFFFGIEKNIDRFFFKVF